MSPDSPLFPDRPRPVLAGWACALTACFISHVTTISATPTEISLEYEGAPYAHLLRIADRHCATFGKIAWPSGNEPVGDGFGHVHGRRQHFECLAQVPLPGH